MSNAPFLGTVQIENAATQVPTITLNGDTAKVSVGGKSLGITVVGGPPAPAYDGHIAVVNFEGNESVTIDGSGTGGSIHLNFHDGKPCLLLGRSVNNDAGPALYMFRNATSTSVVLQGLTPYFGLGGNGASSQMGLFPATAPGPSATNLAEATIHLRASDATIRAGTAGTDGRVLLLNAGGNVAITLDGKSGDIVLANADCAEDFDTVELDGIEPGTVMVIDSEGTLRPSRDPYDKKVAGVISGAGSHRPGIVLDKQDSERNRMPVALMGKVYCKADAQYSPIEVGDLLTTSATPGHAMKAEDALKAFGCVIGKALRPLPSGQGLIPILVALQ